MILKHVKTCKDLESPTCLDEFMGAMAAMGSGKAPNLDGTRLSAIEEFVPSVPRRSASSAGYLLKRLAQSCSVHSS